MTRCLSIVLLALSMILIACSNQTPIIVTHPEPTVAATTIEAIIPSQQTSAITNPTPSLTNSPIPSETPFPTPSPTTESRAVPGFQEVHINVDLPQEKLSILQISADGTLWMGTEHDILKLKDETWDTYLHLIPGQLVGVDKGGRVWVVDQDGMYISVWSGEMWTDYTFEDGWAPLQEFAQVRSRPVMDQHGQIWLSTDQDLRVFNGTSWEIYTHTDLGTSHPLEAEEGLLPSLSLKFMPGINELWMGSCNWTGAGPIGGQGVLRFNGIDWEQVNPKLSSGCTTTITEDNQGNIWIGLDGNIWRYEPATANLTEFEAPPSPFEGGGKFGEVDEITFDHENNPWAEFLFCGGAGCGFGPILYRHQNGEWLQATMDFQYQRKLIFDSDGNPWLLTSAGIFDLSKNELTQVAELQLDPSTVTTNESGRVWFIVINDDQNQLWTLETRIPHTDQSDTQCLPTGETVSINTADLLEPGFENKIAAYLNAFGSADGLQAALTSLQNSEFDPENPEPLKAEVITQDVTGDDRAEVLVSITIPYGKGFGGTSLSTYRCELGAYLGLVSFSRQGAGSRAEGLYSAGGIKFFDIVDLNGNGTAEIIFSLNWPGYAEFYVAEWHEHQFESLIPRYLGPLFEWMINLPIKPEIDSLQLESVPGTDRFDIVITRNHECSEYSSCLPPRTRTEIWSWNEDAFYPRKIKYSVPEYRFQAAVDGDNATRAGEYANALSFYQQAISDQKLNDNWPIEEPLDRNLLEAYSLYRILLLYAYSGQKEDASKIYASLVKNFPEGTVGHEYSILAGVFWDSFLIEVNFVSACSNIKRYAIMNGISLNAPYSDGFYEIEEFNNYYPGDICSYSFEDYQ